MIDKILVVDDDGSSSLHPKDQARAAQYAVAGFLSKPFTVEVLRDIIS